MSRTIFYLPAHGGVAEGEGSDNALYKNSLHEVIKTAHRALAKIGESALSASVALGDLTHKLRELLETRYAAQHVNLEWLAMYEACIVVQLEKLGNDDEVWTFHNSNGAGSEVCAASHYLATHSARFRTGFSPLKLEWRASRYSEYQGDRYSDMIACNRESWMQDLPGDPAVKVKVATDGDMSSHIAVRELAARLNAVRPEGIDFYSSTTIVLDNPDTVLPMYDEMLNVRTLIGEIACGLLCLRKGGAMMVRVTQWETPLARSVIALAADQFGIAKIVRMLSTPPEMTGAYLVYENYRLPDDLQAIANVLVTCLQHEIDETRPLSGYDKLSVTFMSVLSCAAEEFGRSTSKRLVAHSKPGHFKKVGSGEAKEFQQLWLTGHPIVKLPAHATIDQSLF